MTHTHRTALFALALSLATLACSGPKPKNVEQPQEPATVQDTVKQDTVSQETVATVEFDTVNVIARDTLSQKEYNALMAALKPRINTKQRRRKKANAPTRQGYDYNNLEDHGWDESGVPIINIFPNYYIGLYGNVESVREATYTISEGNGIYFKQKSSECLYELNERGDFTRIIHSEPDKRDVILLLCKYDKYGNMTYCKGEEHGSQREWTAKYRYDDKGKLIAKIKTDNSYTENTIFQYDRNGKLIKELGYDEQDKLTSCKRYGPNGKLIEELGYDDKDSLISFKKYDNNGKIIGGTGYDNTVKYKYKYKQKGLYTTQFQYIPDYGWVPTAKYDRQGRIVENRQYLLGSFISYDYKYDSRGNLIYCRYNPRIGCDTEPSEYRYKYDCCNRLIDYTYCSCDGEFLWESISNKFDAQGNLILHEEDRCGYKATAYKYDSQGNVVQKIEYNHENRPVTVTEYNIVYRK